jgi:hypothetical protein
VVKNLLICILHFLCLPKENEASASAKASARQERKGTLNLAFGYPRATVACGGSANSSRQVGTQTVRNLLPHATATLGCVEWDNKNNLLSPFMNNEACLP